MGKIGVGFIGAGFLANMLARCYKSQPDVELVAVSSKTSSHAKNFAKTYGLKEWYTDYEEMVKSDRIDVVNICVPNYLHAQTTIMAAEHGKHVLCTKPLAITLESADEMVKTSRRNNVILMYGENWLFSPTIYRLFDIIKEGALGKILAIEAREQHSGSHSVFATNRKYSGGGVLIHMAVHPIGFIMHTMAKPVKRVYAELANYSKNIEVEDYAVMLIQFEGGGSGIAQSNFITKGGMQDRIEVYGTEGMAFLNLTHLNPIQIYSEVGYSYVVEKASTSRGWTSPTVDEAVQYGFLNMVCHFVNCILKNKEPTSTGKFGCEVLRTIFAGYESNSKKRSVTI